MKAHIRRVACFFLFAAFLLGWALVPVRAQQTVRTLPAQTGALIISGTIVSTGVFQSVVAAGVPNTQQGRLGCVVQNRGNQNMSVFFGPVAAATISTSVVVAPGASVTCSPTGSNVVVTDQVSVTGTTADEFLAIVQ